MRTCLDRLDAGSIIRPCDPGIVAARIKRADRRPQGPGGRRPISGDDCRRKLASSVSAGRRGRLRDLAAAHLLRFGRRQMTVTERNQQTVTDWLQSAHIADSALDWLTCGPAFPVTRNCRFCAGRHRQSVSGRPHVLDLGRGAANGRRWAGPSTGGGSVMGTWRPADRRAWGWCGLGARRLRPAALWWPAAGDGSAGPCPSRS